MTHGPLDGEMAFFEYDCTNRLVKAENTAYEYNAYHYNNIGSTMYLTRNGAKTHEFAYSTYGELTKGGYGEVRFMYNGRLGVMTDSNGLYYMRARYYNPEIRRFINQDVVTGSIENSQSLNRYAYCQGNPVNCLDPFGLSPQSFGSWAGHTVLNVLSFIPVFGNAFDIFNAAWYLYEGNYAEAIACAVGAVPLIGNLVTGFKMGSTFVKGCNIAANVGKASIGFYNGVQNVMNIDSMIRSGTGRWYDYVGQGVLFGLNMFVSASGAMGAWSGISNLVGELNYKKMQRLAQEVSWSDIDGGPELDKLIITRRKFNRTSWVDFEFDLQFFASNAEDGNISITIEGTSYDINKMKRTQPYVFQNTVEIYKNRIIAEGPDSIEPILVRVHNEEALIADGHHRFEAFLQLGYDRVPIKYLHKSQLGKILKDGTYIRTLEELLDGRIAN